MTHRGEVDIRPVLREAHDRGRTIWLPVVDGKQLIHRRFPGESGLKPGTFGQLEPVDSGPESFEWPDLIILPGLAADREGNRLGYGGGYYDRFLSGAHTGAARPHLVMALFEDQIVDRVPVSHHDIPVDALVTELGFRRCFR